LTGASFSWTPDTSQLTLGVLHVGESSLPELSRPPTVPIITPLPAEPNDKNVPDDVR